MYYALMRHLVICCLLTNFLSPRVARATFLGCASLKNKDFCPGSYEANRVCESICGKHNCNKLHWGDRLAECLEKALTPLGCSWDICKSELLANVYCADCSGPAWPQPSNEPFPGCETFVPATNCPVSLDECRQACDTLEKVSQNNSLYLGEKTSPKDFALAAAISSIFSSSGCVFGGHQANKICEGPLVPTTEEPSSSASEPTTTLPLTTPEPTTSDPTTKPTTTELTTTEPTTTEPTTTEPTTTEPTTTEPTATEPTATEPTTTEPTTTELATPEPTTSEATTPEPTTLEPTIATAPSKTRSRTPEIAAAGLGAAVLLMTAAGAYYYLTPAPNQPSFETAEEYRPTLVQVDQLDRQQHVNVMEEGGFV